jgi:hypothetical protein
MPYLRRNVSALLLAVTLEQVMTMNKEYNLPMIVQGNKRLGLRNHVAVYSGYSLMVINRLIESGEIAGHLIGLQIYIDVDEALAVLSKSRFHPKKSAIAASKILSDEQKADLFA